MPNTTTNFSLYLPLVNDPADQDAWGGYLNTNTSTLDTMLDKIRKGYRATSRDANLAAGGVWSNNTTATNVAMNYYNGTADIQLFKIDETNGTAFPKFAGALVNLSANQTISENVATAITWNSESYDTSTIWASSPNPSRLTVPAGVTRVRLAAQVRWQSAASGFRTIQITKNGANFAGTALSTVESVDSASTIQNVTTPAVVVTAGDYFELVVTQFGPGTTIAIQGSGATEQNWFAMECIE